MKKILMVVALFTGLLTADNGNPYVGVGGSFSNADDTQVECRASGALLGGIKFHSKLIDNSIELRSSFGLSGDYTSVGIYMKPQINSVYALVGYGRTEYNDVDFWGGRYGIGYDFGEEFANAFIDIVYKSNEEDTVVTVGIKYKF